MSTTPSAKLTPAQQHVVDRMREGWSLGVDVTFGGGAWMQKGGLGRGGPAEHHIRWGTVHALQAKGIVKSLGYKFPTTEYVLAPEWGTP